MQLVALNQEPAYSRMGINKYLEEIESVFHIFGEDDDDWLPYNERKTFDGYVVKRKTV